jgi:NitT/TauT family transport system substrate-binding protein
LLIRIAAVLFLALLASCNRAPAPPMVFGANVWPGYEPVYLARELGYYSGANLRLAEFGNNSEVMQAFRNQMIQVAAVTLDEALLLHRDIPDLKIILLFDASNGADVIMAQPGITDLKQLQGRRVGVENTALGAYFLSLALDSAGMQARQFDIVPLPVDEQEKAFRAHKVDAVVTFEPVRTRLLADGAQQIFDSSRVPGRILDVLVTRDEYIGEYHHELVQLLQGWRRALDYLKAEPGKAMQTMAGREHIDAVQFSKAMQGLELFGLQRNQELLLGEPPAIAASLEQAQRFMLDRGLLQIGGDASMLVDSTILSEVAP